MMRNLITRRVLAYALRTGYLSMMASALLLGFFLTTFSVRTLLVDFNLQVILLLFAGAYLIIKVGRQIWRERGLPSGAELLVKTRDRFLHKRDVAAATLVLLAIWFVVSVTSRETFVDAVILIPKVNYHPFLALLFSLPLFIGEGLLFPAWTYFRVRLGIDIAEVLMRGLLLIAQLYYLSLIARFVIRAKNVLIHKGT